MVLASTRELMVEVVASTSGASALIVTASESCPTLRVRVTTASRPTVSVIPLLISV